ncbi:MAG TPA: M50 family metallopeptidase [Candidatus Didemnitutus sp.]|nr:M50 family metallopeptidase [Candidatus Didemnitutus sp.]
MIGIAARSRKIAPGGRDPPFVARLDKVWSFCQPAAMDEPDLGASYAALGLQAGCSAEEVERAFMKKNFALIKSADESAREKLRRAHDRVAADVKARENQARANVVREVPTTPVARPKGILPPPVVTHDPSADDPALLSFDNPLVNAVVPPLVVALAWVVNISPLGFFLTGFHVWVHEFGHATAAWMSGRKALPLPIGWTPIEPPYSPMVYFGILLLMVILFIAGWKERKIWAMIAAVAIAALQFVMTWRLTESEQQFYWTFCGVGGEFYLSALAIASFYVQLPEKFRWGGCRYVFLFLGASCFLYTYLRWRDIYHGLEDIPMGSMVNGEDDAGGDMNVLMSDYGWTHSRIRFAYHALGNACLVGLGVVYAVFLLRLNRIPDWIVAKLSRAEPAAGS